MSAVSRRFATIFLLWSNPVVLLLLLASGGEQVFLAWSYAVCGPAMVCLALFGGLLNGPGPKLQGMLRQLHPWGSRAMYALLSWSSLSVVAGQVDHPLPGPHLSTILAITFGTSLLHGCFHLWRSSALNDGALRRMLP